MDNGRINQIIHELSSMGQSCRSYQMLLENPTIRINQKKMKEICGKVARYCLEIRNMFIEEVR